MDFEDSEYICSRCKLDNHSNSSHTILIEDDEDNLLTTICKWEKCLIE